MSEDASTIAELSEVRTRATLHDVSVMAERHLSASGVEVVTADDGAIKRTLNEHAFDPATLISTTTPDGRTRYELTTWFDTASKHYVWEDDEDGQNEIMVDGAGTITKPIDEGIIGTISYELEHRFQNPSTEIGQKNTGIRKFMAKPLLKKLLSSK